MSAWIASVIGARSPPWRASSTTAADDRVDLERGRRSDILVIEIWRRELLGDGDALFDRHRDGARRRPGRRHRSLEIRLRISASRPGLRGYGVSVGEPSAANRVVGNGFRSA